MNTLPLPLLAIDAQAANALVGEYGYRSLDVLSAYVKKQPLPNDVGQDLMAIVEQADLITHTV